MQKKRKTMNLVERIGMREIPEDLSLPYKRSIIITFQNCIVALATT